MVKKTPMTWKCFPMKAQSIQNAFSGVRAGNKPALFSNAKSRQPKTRRGDTSQLALVGGSDIATVPGNAGFRIGLLPEIAEIRSFHFVEKGIVSIGKEFWHRRRHPPGRMRPGNLQWKLAIPSCERSKRGRAGEPPQQFATSQFPSVVTPALH